MIPYEKVKELCLSIGLVETIEGTGKNRDSEFHFFRMPHDSCIDDAINPILVTYYSKFGCSVYLPNNECLAHWVVGEERLEKALEKLSREICKYRKEQRMKNIQESCAEFEI